MNQLFCLYSLQQQVINISNLTQCTNSILSHSQIVIQGAIISQCSNICGLQHFTFGLCLNSLLLGVLVLDKYECIKNAYYNGESCVCSDKYIYNSSSHICVDILKEFQIFNQSLQDNILIEEHKQLESFQFQNEVLFNNTSSYLQNMTQVIQALGEQHKANNQLYNQKQTDYSTLIQQYLQNNLTNLTTQYSASNINILNQLGSSSTQITNFLTAQVALQNQNIISNNVTITSRIVSNFSVVNSGLLTQIQSLGVQTTQSYQKTNTNINTIFNTLTNTLTYNTNLQNTKIDYTQANYETQMNAASSAFDTSLANVLAYVDTVYMRRKDVKPPKPIIPSCPGFQNGRQHKYCTVTASCCFYITTKDGVEAYVCGKYFYWINSANVCWKA
ncbi:Growth_factor receptor cysteine-rich domain superfamily [Hexamita inflata]|uniref:Growth factor receptor cysteine-rich domain superfamily n=1 Tax=Hexamita inflata TaxID=28002 RepID=A0AA86UQ40_9EUKA|nr:Growth factor receptor cysteine-rich domain superfamily [Hexamita inflata]